MKKSTKLRNMFKEDGLIVAPGASTALFAKMIEDAGFDVVYATGAGIANMQFGLPDVGLVTMTEILETVKRMNDAISLPVIADIDNGYGNSINVYRTVREFSRIGIGGLQMEDQILPKKCGHFRGKSVIPKEEMVAKIHAAKDALVDQDIILIARTDAIGVNGFDDAMERAHAYSEAGADIIFVEAPHTIEQLRQIPNLLSKPVLANMVEGGRTPLLTNEELRQMGYKIVLYANGPLKAAVKGNRELLQHLSKYGTTKDCDHLMISMNERNRLTELDKIYEMERKYDVKSLLR